MAEVFESTYPIEVGSVVELKQYEDDELPSARGKIVRQITQEEYIKRSIVEDPINEYYLEDRPDRFYYEIEVD